MLLLVVLVVVVVCRQPSKSCSNSSAGGFKHCMGVGVRLLLYLCLGVVQKCGW
jgi:hypothetical protein